MIFNNNSTRGHTGSLLVFTIVQTHIPLVYILETTSMLFPSMILNNYMPASILIKWCWLCHMNFWIDIVSFDGFCPNRSHIMLHQIINQTANKTALIFFKWINNVPNYLSNTNSNVYMPVTD